MNSTTILYNYLYIVDSGKLFWFLLLYSFVLEFEYEICLDAGFACKCVFLFLFPSRGHCYAGQGVSFPEVLYVL